MSYRGFPLILLGIHTKKKIKRSSWFFLGVYEEIYNFTTCFGPISGQHQAFLLQT